MKRVLIGLVLLSMFLALGAGKELKTTIDVQRLGLTDKLLTIVIVEYYDGNKTTNYYSNVKVVNITTNVITNDFSTIKKLEMEIKLREKRFHEVYDGLPETFTSPSTEQSKISLDKLQKLWYDRDIDKAEIDVKKKELEKLKGNK